MKYYFLLLFATACSSSTSATINDTDAKANLVNVTFVGDSISVGFDDIERDPLKLNGFRLMTDAILRSRNLPYTFAYTGPEIYGSLPTSHTMAFSGARTAQQVIDMKSFFGEGKIHTDCFRIQIGTNDMNRITMADYKATFGQLLSTIKQAEPNAVVSVAMVPPAGPTFDQARSEFNTVLVQVIGNAVDTGQKVILEKDPGLDWPVDFGAGHVHFVASGNIKEAIVAANGIEEALSK